MRVKCTNRSGNIIEGKVINGDVKAMFLLRCDDGNVFEVTGPDVKVQILEKFTTVFVIGQLDP